MNRVRQSIFIANIPDRTRREPGRFPAAFGVLLGTGRLFIRSLLLFLLLAPGPGLVALASGPALPGDVLQHLALFPLKSPGAALRASGGQAVHRAFEQAGVFDVIGPKRIAKELSVPPLTLAAFSDEQAVEIGRRLGMDAVVTGSLKPSGKQLRLILRLTSCADGTARWRYSATLPSDSKLDKLAAPLLAELKTRWPQTASDTTAGSSAEAAGGLAPPTPEDLAAEATGLRSITLTWAPPRGKPYRYRVERSQRPAGPFEQLDDVSPRRLQYRDADPKGVRVRDGATYYYRLVPVTRGGSRGRPTPPVHATTAPLPAAPPDLVATASAPREIHLAWSPSPAPQVLGYRIERKPAGAEADFEAVGETAETGYTDRGGADSPLLDDAVYVYRLRAVNAVEAVGPPTSPLVVRTRPPPAPVTGLAADDRSVRCVPLHWQAHPDPDVVAYRLYRSGNTTDDFQLLKVLQGRTHTRYVDGGDVPGDLPDDTTYYYMVRAENRVGALSAPSAVVRATTRRAPPPVRNIRATSGEPRQVSLRWEASADEKVAGYQILRAQGEARDFVLIGESHRRESNTFIDRGGTRRKNGLGLLLDGTTYAYRILAVNIAGVASPPSTIARATTKAAPARLADPQTTTSLPHAIRVSWETAPEADIEHYFLDCASGPRFLPRKRVRIPHQTELREHHYELQDLDNGEARFFRLKSVDRDGLESPWTAIVQGRAKPAPMPPRNLTAHTESDAILLRWDAPPQADVFRYIVWIRNRMRWEALDETQNTFFRIPADAIRRRASCAVSAMDRDQLQSARSNAVKIDSRQ